ncbi:Polyadenylate-binding protein, cytoplasmic and nuclear [Wickerhamomyces ciferrii]|uniref:Polyadenylate-binding protein, cytoplasmic and nuclear n=1 Tax=Wickerhamomyces ciferrii (strain ATCC 14091 / BCRC 22168 / CBS 111 / JCM 3599 / NBRC 0793 / NRRL Y-1031 F-60-10) TaxID=1206466 RepID=K0KUP4_WICCF|nr:Polyadenylate-binding protein, cytoplasmic and nuclear [Wickerhamomyces ciferrii]CCH46916.1 Polyadenylate-binding protein, cytoplasmic and nuclear [Wickerhamomyces ciferrii]
MSSNQEVSVPTNKLYVGNIEYSTTKAELKDLFKDYEIFKNGKTGKPKAKGYVFVTFNESVKDLDEIISKFTDYEFKDRKIYLSRPAPREEGETKEIKTKPIETKSTETSSKPVKKSFKPQQSKEKIPFEKGTKSTDTVYLKNLDFQTNAKELRTFFTEEGEEVKWVSVPFKRLPGFVLKKLSSQGKEIEKRNKGYAFIRFKINEDESIEDKVSKYQGKLFKERELQLSVAVDVRNVEGEGDEEDEE